MNDHLNNSYLLEKKLDQFYGLKTQPSLNKYEPVARGNLRY